MRKVLFFVLCAVMLSVLPAQAQQVAPRASYKDPGTATILSVVIPGGGQFYAGDTRKGLTIMGVGLGGITVGMAMTGATLNAAPALLGYAAYLGSWVYGIMDAEGTTHRMNAKHGVAQLVPENITPVVIPSGTKGTRVGVSVQF